MNAQIEKLAEQAGMIVDKYGLARDAQNGLEDGVDIYKFAALLIQECVQVCLDQAPYDPHVLSYKPSEQFALSIKQHFGVTE